MLIWRRRASRRTRRSRAIAVTLGAALATATAAAAGGIARPNIESRKAWNAAAPLPATNGRTPMAPNSDPKFAGIAVHATATWRALRPGQKPEKVTAGHQGWHQKCVITDGKKVGKCWQDIAYHFLIAPDGRIFEGRSLDRQSDTGQAYPRDRRVTIVLEGNFDDGRDSAGRFHKADVFTSGQRSSLDALVAWLADVNGLSASAIAAPAVNGTPHPISDHGELTMAIGNPKPKQPQTACPGAPIHDYLPTLRRKTADALRAAGRP